MQPIQIILIPFLFFAISRVYLRAKEGTLSPGDALFWLSLFSLAGFGIIDPNFTTYLAKQLGIGRGTDVVIYISIVLLFYLIFRTNVHLENLRHDITKLVQAIALLEKDPNPKKSPAGKK